MCARLLTCPLCSQPGFLNLDAMRAGLVSVATRPLACPVCNEVLLGIEKLTIHLFSHTIAQNNANNESSKIIEVTSNGNMQTIMRNAQSIPIQSWNVLNTAQTVDASNKEDSNRENNGSSGIYIPIDEIETFRNLAGMKEVNNVIPVSNSQNITTEMQGTSQVILLQNVSSSQPKIFSANLINQTSGPAMTNSPNQQESLATNIYQTIPTKKVAAANAGSIEIPSQQDIVRKTEPEDHEVIIIDNDSDEKSSQETWSENRLTTTQSPSKYPPSHTDRLADLVRNAQISASPLSTFHDYFETAPENQLTPTPSQTIPEVIQMIPKPTFKSTRPFPASERTERCNICGFQFIDRTILSLHKQLVHMVKEKGTNASSDLITKKFPCYLCTKVFKMRGSLMVHMRVAHSGVNKLWAEKREEKNAEAAKLAEQTKEQFIEEPIEAETSQNSESNDNSEQVFNCPECGKSFKKEQHVMQHIKIHEGKQFECDVCYKMFTTKYFLKKHKRLHSGEMPYKCQICDKTFTFQQSFHKHRLYHRDEKPHSCTTCGRSFKELSTLHNHERIHTGEKPFACETCGKCFRQRVSYLVHRRIHTGAMPYKCATCDKTFRYKVSLRTHKCPHQTDQNSENVENSEMKETPESLRIEEESMDASITSEDNQFVFVLNEDGQHVLKRQSEIDNAAEKNTPSAKSNLNDKHNEDSSGSSNFLESLWNQESNSKEADSLSKLIKDTNMWSEASGNKDNSLPRKSAVSDEFTSKEAANEFANGLWNQNSSNSPFDKKSQPNTDFFSMVMSPLENQISSPSTEMKHLRLSSPENNQENSSEALDCFPPINNTSHAVQVAHEEIEGNFSESANLSTLQTINEDSLKALLYGIADK